MAQQVSHALPSMLRDSTLHDRDAIRLISELVVSLQKMEERMVSILTNFTAGMKEVVALQTQTRIHLEALETFKAQARTPPRSPRRSAPVPLSEVNGTSPSTSPEGPRNTLSSTEVITRDAASRCRTKGVAVVACSSGPRLSTSRDQSTEQHFPNQNHTQELSGMFNASTVTVGNHPQSPRSSAGAGLGLRNNISVDVSMPDAGGNSSRSGGNPTFDQGNRTTFNNEGNVGFGTGESSQSNGHLDRVHRSQDGGRRIAGGVRAGAARPQQYPVPPASPAAVPGGARPQVLSRAVNGDRVVKPSKDPRRKKPLLVNGRVTMHN